MRRERGSTQQSLARQCDQVSRGWPTFARGWQMWVFGKQQRFAGQGEWIDVQLRTHSWELPHISSLRSRMWATLELVFALLRLLPCKLRLRRRRHIFSFQQILQLRHELLHVLEIEVDGGETDVGDLVLAAQPVHDQ